MTKKIVLAVNIVFFTASLLFAAEDVSFRLKGMHSDLQGIIRDEYTDMMFMPYNILEVDGYRLYTNLSNLSNGDEYALNGSSSSVNEYLIGGVAPMGRNGKLGFIFSDDSSEMPETILDDWGGSIGTGEYENITDNKLADTYDRTYGKAEDKTAYSDISALAGLRAEGSMRFGLLVGYSDDTMNQSNYYYKLDDNLASGTSYYSLTTRDQTYDYENRTITLAPAVELKVGDRFTVGGMAGFLQGKKTQASNTQTSWYSTPNFGGWGTPYGWISSTHTYSRVDTSAYGYDMSGSGFSARLTGSYSASADVTVRGYIDYRSLSLSGGYDAPTVYNIINDGSAGSSKSEYLRNGDASQKNSNMAVGAGFESRLDPKLMFSMGIKYSAMNSQGDESYSRLYKYNSVAQYYSYAYSYSNKDDEETLALPVGIESSPNKWARIRFGASHSITTKADESGYTYTYYDGSAYPARNVSSVDTTVSPKESTVDRKTDYSFGAGFAVTDNLQIDLLNFTNLTDMSLWKLSATLKFYGNKMRGSGRKTGVRRRKEISKSKEKKLKKKYWKKAVREYNKGNYEKAINYWEKILDIDPDHKASLKRIERAQKQMEAAGY